MITTLNDKASLINLASPVPLMLPYPDSSEFSLQDKAMLIRLYHGIVLNIILARGLVCINFLTKQPDIVYNG